MKKIYSILRPNIERKSYANWITNDKQHLAISTKNLIAFTSSFCLNQTKPTQISYHLYLADLNQPYQPYLLTQSQTKFALIEWDPSGARLLVANSTGLINIYSSKNFLINDWRPIFCHSFSAETFLASLWYHSGIISSIQVPNLDLKGASESTNHIEYSDKIKQSKSSASLRLFGGKAAEGCLLVSSTGLIVCLTLLSDGSIDIVTESLGPLRSRLHVADISYHRDGSFIIASSSGSINSTIAFHRVNLALKNLTLDDVDTTVTSASSSSSSSALSTSTLPISLAATSHTKRVRVNCKQYHSFHLNVMSQILNERENTNLSTTATTPNNTFQCVNQIKFVSKDMPNDILVEVGGPNLSLIELWELETKKKPPVHSAILELKNITTTSSPATTKIKLEPGACTTTSTSTMTSKNDNDNQTLSDTNNTTTTQSSSESSSSVSASPPDQVASNLDVEWSFKGNYISEKELVSIQVPRFRLFGNSSRLLSIIMLSYNDSTLCCLRKDDLQPIDESIDLNLGDLLGHQQSPNGTYKSTGGSGGLMDSATKSPYKVYSNVSAQRGPKTISTSSSSPAANSSATNPNGSTSVQRTGQSANKMMMMMSMMMGDNKTAAAVANNGKSSNYHSSILNINRANNFITDLQFSTNQTVLIAIDKLSQLHALKLPPLLLCKDSHDEEIYLQYILEYCLVTGNDWWDVLVCVQTNSIESICDRFHDAYERQPKHIQRMYFNKQLMIRASLYRCLNQADALCKSSDCHTMIMLNSISCTLKSMLRQSSDQEDSPAEQLSSLLKTTTSSPTGSTLHNCNNVIGKLNEKEFYVEVSLIQCLQPLMQWIVDLSIYLVASLPQLLRPKGAMLPGSGLSRSKEALESLRELLVIIRIWSSQNEASFPQVHRLTDQIDVIGSLYKLISKLHVLQLSYSNNSTVSNNGSGGVSTNNDNDVKMMIQTSSGTTTTPTKQQQPPVDAQLMEECLQFINSITLTQFKHFLPAVGVASPLLHNQDNHQHNQKNQHYAHHQQQYNNYNHHYHQHQQHQHNKIGLEDSSMPTSTLVLEYFQWPLPQAELVNLDSVEGSLDLLGNRKLDIIRNISLGAHTLTNIRQCTRCNAVSLIRPPTTGGGGGSSGSANSANNNDDGLTKRVWEQRWMMSCICGGPWAQSSLRSGSELALQTSSVGGSKSIGWPQMAPQATSSGPTQHQQHQQSTLSSGTATGAPTGSILSHQLGGGGGGGSQQLVR